VWRAKSFCSNAFSLCHQIGRISCCLVRPWLRLFSFVSGKVELLHLPVDNLVSLNNDYVDKIFHCNCYYFWPSLLAGSKVLYRVLKPGGLMITTLSLDSIKFADKSGYIPSKNSDPVRYMGALEYAGFKDVKIEYHTDAEFKMDYQCITATKPIL